MLRVKRFNVAIAFCLGILGCYAPFSSAEEPVDSVAPQTKAPLKLATQMESVIEAVLKHHREPPARQQMILAVLRSVVDKNENTNGIAAFAASGTNMLCSNEETVLVGLVQLPM